MGLKDAEVADSYSVLRACIGNSPTTTVATHSAVKTRNRGIFEHKVVGVVGTDSKDVLIDGSNETTFLARDTLDPNFETSQLDLVSAGEQRTRKLGARHILFVALFLCHGREDTGE